MLGRGKWLRKAALLLALCAGGVGASAPSSTGAAWRADPDDQFLLDVNIRQLRLGDGVRAYNTPEGTCVVLGDFLTTLDVPMRIDLTARKASGWAFKETNRISIDYAAGAVTYAGKNERSAAGTIREMPEGWCVQTAALSRWFGIGVKPSDDRLGPRASIGYKASRRTRDGAPAARGAHSTRQLRSRKLAAVRVPYRMWRAPALDFVVSAGVTYRASDGMRVDRQSSVFAAGEIAHLSYDAQVTTTQKGKPSLLRLRAYRSDPDGGLLGPLHATHFGMGDVEGFDSGLTGSVAAGRGAVDHQSPAFSARGVRPHAFRRGFAERVGSGNLPQRRAAGLRQVRLQASAMSLTMFSFSTARTRSRSSSMAHRDRSGLATKWSMSDRTMFPPARPGTGRGSTSPGATSSSWRSLRTVRPSPRPRRRFRSSTASTTGRRWACSLARC